MKGITTRQLDLIDDIQDLTKHKFIGKTEKEAVEFIERHIQEYTIMSDVYGEVGLQ